MQCPFLSATAPPVLQYRVWREFAAVPKTATPEGNFLKGVYWSPDGVCLLTASDDNCVRLFDLPEEGYVVAATSVLETTSAAPEKDAAASEGAGAEGAADMDTQPSNAAESDAAAAASTGIRSNCLAGAPALGFYGSEPPSEPSSLAVGLAVPQGELVYDYCWYSGMTSSDPTTCCFATCCRAHPVRLWDACNGHLRSSYRCYDDKDELSPAHCAAFGSNNLTLITGLNKRIALFDVTRPGRDSNIINTFRKKHDGQNGIISCVAPCLYGSSMFAAGCYDGSVGVYDAGTLEQLLLLHGHEGGVTQVLWSKDGNFLYSGARRDPNVYCWDVRHTYEALYCMERDSATTNQRIQMDIEPYGRSLVTGGQQGQVDVFDLQSGTKWGSFSVASDTVNGVAFHPHVPLIATASGHRQYGQHAAAMRRQNKRPYRRGLTANATHDSAEYHNFDHRNLTLTSSSSTGASTDSDDDCIDEEGGGLTESPTHVATPLQENGTGGKDKMGESARQAANIQHAQGESRTHVGTAEDENVGGDEEIMGDAERQPSVEVQLAPERQIVLQAESQCAGAMYSNCMCVLRYPVEFMSVAVPDSADGFDGTDEGAEALRDSVPPINAMPQNEA